MTKHLQPDAMLCFDIYALHHAFGRLYKPLLDPLGLTYPQYLVMVVLWGQDPMRVGQIGAQLGLESSTLTPMIKRLETGGLVRRQRDNHDERRVQVHLTDKGRELADRAADIPACIEAATKMERKAIQALRQTLAQLQISLAPENAAD